MSKFTNIEIAILNKLHRVFTVEDLNKIVVYTISTVTPYWDVGRKYLTILKHYGLMPEPNEYGHHTTHKLTELTKYAKWVVDNIPDNWPNDEVSQQGNFKGEAIDFRKIENPIRAELSNYEVTASESGSQTIYKSGTAEVLAWDEDDATEKVEDDFYEWGGEMEDEDYGDWYSDGMEVEDVNLIEQIMLERKYGIIQHQPVRPGNIINESTSKMNPELKVGDIVRVIDVDGEHGRMPKRFGIYKVVKVGNAYPLMAMRNRGHDTYYDIVTYPELESLEFSELDVKSLYRGDTWIYGDIPMANKVDRKTISEGKEWYQSMSKDEVQSVVDKVYPHIINTLGGSDYFDIPPTVELWEDIYARVSGIEGMEGEHSASSKAQFDDTVNTIFIYYPNMKDEKHVIQSLLHEYTHSLQDPNKKEENRKDGYEVDPDEMAALKAESTWEYYMGYIKHDLNEHKQSKFNPELMVGDEVTVVNVDKSYGTMNTPKHLKDYVVTGIKYRQPENWEGPEADTKYYVIVPIGGYSDEEATGRMLSGGGRITEEHLYSTDTWMLKKGFLRGELDEHGADTSWANDDDKVTLEDILELTKDIPIISYPTKELAKLPSLKNIVLGWDPKEIERISQVDVSRQYPILIMVNEYNEVQWILDGNHRAQQAVMNDIPTIPAKLIKPSDLDERSIKMFYPEGIPKGETNEASRTLSKARKAGVDTYYPKSAVKANPQRFRKYTRDKYVNENKVDDSNINDLVWSEKPTKKHLQKMDNTLGNFKGFNLDEFKNTPPPKNDSKTTEKEIEEYCPMGKPNKCKLVDYNNLPDMITDEVIEEQFNNEMTMADAFKKDVMKVLAMRFILVPTEDSNIKNGSGQSYSIIDTENPLEEITIDTLIQPIIDMFNDGVVGGELSPEDTNIAISGVTDWLSLAMNQTIDLPN